MTADEAIVAVLDALEAAGIPYMIVGSLASNFHAVPRSTRNADFVVELGPESLGWLVSVASAEDMIVTKLRWLHEARRAKDRDDIRNMLAVRAPDPDWPYLRRWAAGHGTSTLRDQIHASLPKTD